VIDHGGNHIIHRFLDAGYSLVFASQLWTENYLQSIHRAIRTKAGLPKELLGSSLGCIATRYG
jgi:hypothetical protein